MGAIPTMPTFVDGEIPTAAKLNQIKTCQDFWANTPKCSLYQSAAQSVAVSGTTQVLNFDSEVYDIVQAGDTESHSATFLSRLFIRTTGRYDIVAQYQAATNATGSRACSVRANAGGNPANGTLIVQNQQGAVTGVSTSVLTQRLSVPLVAGDYLELFANQTSGAALNTVPGVGVTYLEAKLVGV